MRGFKISLKGRGRAEVNHNRAYSVLAQASRQSKKHSLGTISGEPGYTMQDPHD